MASPEPRHGVWGIPVTLGWLPGSQASLAWAESARNRPPVDPSLAVSQDDRWVYGAGLSYTWASRWQLMGQAVYSPQPSLDVEWSAKSTLQTHPVIAVSDPSASVSGNDWGFAVTVVIPLGK